MLKRPLVEVPREVLLESGNSCWTSQHVSDVVTTKLATEEAYIGGSTHSARGGPSVGHAAQKRSSNVGRKRGASLLHPANKRACKFMHMLVRTGTSGANQPPLEAFRHKPTHLFFAIRLTNKITE